MSTDINHTPPAEECEDHSDHYKPITVAEVERLCRECCETDDWFTAQKLALRIFRAAPNPREAEAARAAFKIVVNAMHGRDDQGETIPGGVSEHHVRTLHGDLLKLLGITQPELFAPKADSDVFLKVNADTGQVKPAPELANAVKAMERREEAKRLRRIYTETITSAKFSDEPGAVQLAKEDGEHLRKKADALEAEATALEGGAK